MSPVQTLFLQLMQLGAGLRHDVPRDGVDADGWQQLWEMALQHGIEGVVFEGICQLTSATKPPMQVLTMWVAQVQRNEQLNRQLNAECRRVCERLKQDGISTCLLKGQGHAMLYPNPYVRTPGDIDLWADRGRDRLVKYVHAHFPRQTIRYHHIDLPCLPNTSVELHFTPSYLYQPLHNRRLQQWFREQQPKQMAHVVELSSGEQVATPTTAFNAVYLLTHLYRHLLPEGINLKQLLDYHFVVSQLTPPEREEAYRVICHVGMRKFCAAVMYVLQVAFHMKDDCLLCPPDKKEGDFLLNEVLNSVHKERVGEGMVMRNLRYFSHTLRLVKHYPTEALCEPLFRLAWWAYRLFHFHTC